MIKGRVKIETIKKVRAAMSLLGFDTCPFALPEISHDPKKDKDQGSCHMTTRNISVNTNIVSSFTMYHELTHSQQVFNSCKNGYCKANGDIDLCKYRDDIYEQQANIIAGLLTGIVSIRELFFVFYITKNQHDFLYICQNIVLQKRQGLPALESNFYSRNIKKMLSRAGRVKYGRFLKSQFQEKLTAMKNHQI